MRGHAKAVGLGRTFGVRARGRAGTHAIERSVMTFRRCLCSVEFGVGCSCSLRSGRSAGVGMVRTMACSPTGARAARARAAKTSTRVLMLRFSSLCSRRRLGEPAFVASRAPLHLRRVLPPRRRCCSRREIGSSPPWRVLAEVIDSDGERIYGAVDAARLGRAGWRSRRHRHRPYPGAARAWPRGLRGAGRVDDRGAKVIANQRVSVGYDVDRTASFQVSGRARARACQRRRTIIFCRLLTAIMARAAAGVRGLVWRQSFCHRALSAALVVLPLYRLLVVMSASRAV